MRQAPGATDDLTIDWGSTGATLGVRVLDGQGATTIARTTGFAEYPAGSGVYQLDEFTFPDDRGSYTLLYDDDGGTAAVGHVATEELIITSSTGEPFDGDTYGTTAELFRLLKINNPTAAQTEAAERVLTMATGETDSELDREDDDPIAGWEISLATEVCLERAVELWRETPFGIVGIDSDIGGTHTARNTWERYAHKLAPAKRQWGLA